MILKFTDLEAWQLAKSITVDVYNLTKRFPETEKFGLISQLCRASSSIMANIAEGFARYHYKDKVKFYYYSRGSVAEVMSFIYLAEELGYISSDVSAKLIKDLEHEAKLVNGLINSIKKLYS